MPNAPSIGEGDGSDLAVHDRADIGRLGALCCWEHLQPLSKYAMYAQNEQVHVGGLAELFAVRPLRPCARLGSQQRREQGLRGRRLMLRPRRPARSVSQAMIDELCDSPEKHAFLHAGGGHAVIYGPDGSSLAEKLPPEPGGHSLCRYRPRHDRRGQERRRSSRSLFPARRHPAAAQPLPCQPGGALQPASRCRCHE